MWRRALARSTRNTARSSIADTDGRCSGIQAFGYSGLYKTPEHLNTRFNYRYQSREYRGSDGRKLSLAKKALIEKQKRKPKFAVRAYTRCNVCGRPRGVFRKFMLCRICIREMAHKGLIPGMTKSSW